MSASTGMRATTIAVGYLDLIVGESTIDIGVGVQVCVFLTYWWVLSIRVQGQVSVPALIQSGV